MANQLKKIIGAENLTLPFIVENIMNLEELWIGEFLEVIGLNKVGTYEGKQGDLARVKIDEKIEYFKADQLRIAVAKDGDSAPDEKSDASQVKFRDKFRSEIDLHLDQLPAFEKSRWPQPIDYQIHRCKTFVANAILHRATQITIIHGVGEGVLRNAVEDLLHHTPEVLSTSSAHGGGATVVELSFT